MIDTLAARLRDTYVDSAVGGAMSSYLLERARRREYQHAGPEKLAALLTTDMQHISRDKHLRVRFRPSGTTATTSREDTTGAARRRDLYLRDARWENYGFKEVQVFPGAVGFIRFNEFYNPRYASNKLGSVMEFLRDSRAVIIDLRRNGGGYDAMVQQIAGYFLPQSLLWTRTDRVNRTPRQVWSAPAVPGGPFDRSVFIYVLTSKRTFSAAEQLASALKGSARATLIGETTAGGGNFGSFFRLNDRFDVFIPYGSTIDGYTGKSLEGIGVTPDIHVAEDSALFVARKLALERIRASLDDADLIVEVNAALADLVRQK